jgi:hypothetical protein
LLYAASGSDRLLDLLSRGISGLGNRLLGWGATGLATPMFSLSEWVADSLGTGFTRVTDALAWPFKAVIAAAVNGGYDRAQALAPAVLLLYATVLILLAASLFHSKDLFLSE